MAVVGQRLELYDAGTLGFPSDLRQCLVRRSSVLVYTNNDHDHHVSFPMYFVLYSLCISKCKILVSFEVPQFFHIIVEVYLTALTLDEEKAWNTPVETFLGICSTVRIFKRFKVSGACLLT